MSDEMAATAGVWKSMEVLGEMIRALESQLAAAEAERDKLSTALRTYGWHHGACATEGGRRCDTLCNCGLRDTLLTETATPQREGS